MVDATCDFILYKVPSIDIVQRRRVFYGLQKEKHESAGKWLNRVRKQVVHCEFIGFSECLLIDKFVSQLNSNEIAIIQSTNTWSLKQLTEHFLDEIGDITLRELDECPMNIDENTPIEPTAHIIKEEDLSEDTDSSITFEPSYEIPSGAMTSEIEECDYSVTDLLELELNDNDEPTNEIPNIQKNQHAPIEPTKIDSGRAQLHNKYHCAHCNINYQNQEELEKHILIAHDENLMQNMTDPVIPSSHACQLCNRNFTKLRYLKKHLITHTSGERNTAEKKVYACSLCKKSFTQLATLKRHKLRIHENNKIRPHACKECDKCFFTADELRNHSMTHTGEKPFACNLCDKAFSQLSNMNTHKRTVHEKYRPHACKDCDKCFATAHDLRRHSIIHKNSEKKPYPCNLCDKSFNQPYDLTRHKKTCHENHISFNCQECGKVFATAKTLKHHSIIHTGETRPTCVICDKSFSNLGNLNVHKSLVHENQRSYACKKCDKCFARPLELKCHSITHTKKK